MACLAWALNAAPHMGAVAAATILTSSTELRELEEAVQGLEMEARHGWRSLSPQPSAFTPTPYPDRGLHSHSPWQDCTCPVPNPNPHRRQPSAWLGKIFSSQAPALTQP